MNQTLARATLFAVTCLALAGACAAGTQERPAGATTAPAPASHRAGATALLVQDFPPWGARSNELVLDDLGVVYDIVGSDEFGSIDLASYSAIIVASVQLDAFYAAIGKRMPAVEAWLHGGPRTLEYHAAWFVPGPTRTFLLPGGIRVRDDLRHVNVLSGTDSPLLAGLPGTMHGDYASHVSFVRATGVEESILIAAPVRRPVMLDYCIGPGRVIATGQTVEYGYRSGWDFAPVLPNMISASTLAPGCPG